MQRSQLATWRLLCSSFLVVTCFWLGTLIYCPKRNYIAVRLHILPVAARRSMQTAQFAWRPALPLPAPPAPLLHPAAWLPCVVPGTCERPGGGPAEVASDADVVVHTTPTTSRNASLVCNSL